MLFPQRRDGMLVQSRQEIPRNIHSRHARRERHAALGVGIVGLEQQLEPLEAAGILGDVVTPGEVGSVAVAIRDLGRRAVVGFDADVRPVAYQVDLLGEGGGGIRYCGVGCTWSRGLLVSECLAREGGGESLPKSRPTTIL
jgi:hypothetical protein